MLEIVASKGWRDIVLPIAPITGPESAIHFGRGVAIGDLRNFTGLLRAWTGVVQLRESYCGSLGSQRNPRIKIDARPKVNCRTSKLSR